MTRGRPIQCGHRRESNVANADWQRILGQNLRTDADSKFSRSAHLCTRRTRRIYSHPGLSTGQESRYQSDWILLLYRIVNQFWQLMRNTDVWIDRWHFGYLRCLLLSKK